MGYNLLPSATLIGLFCSLLLASGSILPNPILQELEEKSPGFNAYKSADHGKNDVKTANEKVADNRVTSDERDLNEAEKDHRERGYTTHVDNVGEEFVNGPSHDHSVNSVTLTGANNKMTDSSNSEDQDDNDPDTVLTQEKQNKKNCSTCGGQDLEEETVKELRLSMFAELLRQKLRMPEIPEEEESSTEKAPGLPSDLFQKIFQNEAANEEQEEFYAIDDEILIPGESVDDMCNDLGMTGCYKFDLKDKFTNDIATASLWFNRSHDRTGKLRSQHLKIYEIEVLSGVTHRKLIPLGRNDLVNKNGWVSLNMTKFLKRWVEEGAENKVLAIKCDYSVSGNSEGGKEHKFDYSSVLEIKYTKAKIEQRKKKNANPDNCDPKTECCKRPLAVNFDAIGMHNIYRPPTLNVDFCYGTCEGVNHYTYNHTVQRQKYRNHITNETVREQLKPCCVPLVLKDTTMFVLEHHDLVRKIMRNVIVESCGCL